jgi:hypothetical protein
MFALLSDRTTTRRPQFARLRLEALEARNAPASLTLAVTYGKETNVTFTGTLSGVSNPANQTIYLEGSVCGSTTTDANGNFSVTLAATSPGDVSAMVFVPSPSSTTVTLTDPGAKIDVFQALETPGNRWDLKGHVAYSRPFDSFIVNFGAAQTAIMGKTATTDSSGNFDITVQLSGTSRDNGTVTAFTYDPWGNMSPNAYQVIEQAGT